MKNTLSIRQYLYRIYNIRLMIGMIHSDRLLNNCCRRRTRRHVSGHHEHGVVQQGKSFTRFVFPSVPHDRIVEFVRLSVASSRRCVGVGWYVGVLRGRRRSRYRILWGTAASKLQRTTAETRPKHRDTRPEVNFGGRWPTTKYYINKWPAAYLATIFAMG